MTTGTPRTTIAEPEYGFFLRVGPDFPQNLDTLNQLLIRQETMIHFRLDAIFDFQLDNDSNNSISILDPG